MILVGVALAALAGVQESLEQRVAALSRRIEDIRGRPFNTPVPVRDGSRKERAGHSIDEAHRMYGTDLRTCERALASLGLIPSKLRLDLAIGSLALQSSLPYLSTGSLALISRTVADDELVFRLSLAHSDQVHKVREAAGSRGADFDAQMALMAVHQGEADMTKQLFWAGKKGDDPMPEGHIQRLRAEAERWEREGSRFASLAVPRLFVRAADFGYRRGGIFMEEMRQKEGMKAVETAYLRPPVSTEQILHPGKYAAQEPPVLLLPLQFDEKLALLGFHRRWATTLGELGTAILLESHLKDAGPSCSEGWGGDAFWYYEDSGPRPMAIWATVWDTEKDAAEFHAAAVRLCPGLPRTDDQHESASVRRGTSVAVLANLPRSRKEDILAALWKCSRTDNHRSEPYGPE